MVKKRDDIMKKALLDHIAETAHIREFDRADIPQLFAENVARMRTELNYTQDDMAYMLGIGKQTYFRIEAGTNASVNAEIALKLSNIFKVPVMSLFGFSTDNVDAYKDYMKCTDRTKRVLRRIAAADISMQSNFAEYDPDDIITVLSFAEELHDGMNISRFLFRNESISIYRNFRWYQDADCLLEINSNAYHPLYHMRDRLVICSRAPLDGEIGVFLKDSCFYLRKVKNSLKSVYLLPVAYYENTPCADMVVNRHNPDDMNNYQKFGTVIAVI